MQLRAQLPERCRVSLDTRERRLRIGVPLERHLAGKAFVEHETERIEVCTTVEFVAAYLLGREVLGRTHHDVLAGEVLTGVGREHLGDTEIGEQYVVVRRDEDVCRLHIAMDDRLFGIVRGVERTSHTRCDVQRLLGRQMFLLVEEIAQALAGHERHDHCLASVVLHAVVDRHDVGVLELGDDPRLTPESLDCCGVRSELLLEHLDRDDTVEEEVGGKPHLCHAAVREFAINAIAPR